MAKWSEERKANFQAAKQAKNETEKTSETRERMRVPVSGARDITAVHNQDPNYQYRWVTDKDGRIDKFKDAGYEHASKARVGDSTVDGTHNEDGVVSKDMGQGDTGYLMKQKREWFLQDQAAKQKTVDETEESMRTDENETRNDGRYGKVDIGKPRIN